MVSGHRRAIDQRYSPAHVAQSPPSALAPASTDMLQGGPSGESAGGRRALPTPSRLFAFKVGDHGREPEKERIDRRRQEKRARR